MKTNTLSWFLVSLLTCFAFLQPAHSAKKVTAYGDGALEKNQGDNNTAFGHSLSVSTRLASKIQPPVLSLSTRILKAIITPPPVFKPFLRVAPAAATRPPGNRPCRTTGRAATTILPPGLAR